MSDTAMVVSAYRGITDGLTYREVLYLEMERQLGEQLAKLGPKPPWWRFRMRKLHPLKVQVFKDHFMDIMRWLLAEHDPRKRTIMASLVGWQLPREHADDFDTVANSPDPEVLAMWVRAINIKRGRDPNTRIEALEARYLLRFWAQATKGVQ